MEKLLMVGVGLTIALAVAWVAMHRNASDTAANSVDAPDTTATRGGKASSTPAAASLAPTAPLGSTTQSSVAKSTQANALSTLRQSFQKSPSLSGVYRQASALDTGEAAFIKARILQDCAKIVDTESKRSYTPVEERRKAFLASLPLNGADNAMRISAFDKLFSDRCGELRNLQVTRSEVAALFEKAAQANEPAAVARDAQCNIESTYDKDSPGFPTMSITAEQFAKLPQLLRSKDPAAISAGIALLGNTYRNATIHVNGRSLEAESLMHASELIACQYGADCNRWALAGCAMQGKCALGNYNDYLAYYELSPSSAQHVEEYRTAFTRMIETADFSTLTFTPVQTNSEVGATGITLSCSKF